LLDLTFISTSSDIQTYNIRRVSAYLKKHGFKTRIIFLVQPFEKRYSEKVLKQVVELCMNSRLIGISLMSNYWNNTIQIINALRKSYNNLIIGGGPHPSTSPEECLEHVDMVCVGEGDDTLLQLITKLRDGDNNFTGIPNLYFKKNNKIIKNHLANFEKTDEIPIPDYDLEDHYVLFEGKIQPISYNLFRCFYSETYSTQFTFGCPFTCSFCIHNLYNKRFKFRFRKRKIKDVISELKYIKNKFPFIEKLRIDDDTFFYYTKEEFEYFRDEYKKYVNLPIYVTGGQPTVIKEELIKPLVEAGMTKIRVGIQTAAERIKRQYKRVYPNKKMLEACKVINSFKDLKVTYDFILDNPWETDEETIETLKFILEIPQPFELSLFSLTFFPGTDLYNKALEDGIIKDSEEGTQKHYYSIKNTYLNLLFYIFYVRWIPKKFKLFLLKDNVRKSNFAPLIIYILRSYRWYDDKKSLAIFLFHYVRKLDLYRTIFSVKKYFYDSGFYGAYGK